MRPAHRRYSGGETCPARLAHVRLRPGRMQIRSGDPPLIDRMPRRWTIGLLCAEIANASYLASCDSATILYHANVVAHVAIGVPLGIWMLCRAWMALVSGMGSGIPGALTRVVHLAATVLAVT